MADSCLRKRRFAEVSSDDLETFRLESTPTNTRRNTDYAVNLYKLWANAGGYPPLDCGLVHLLASHIPKFIAEVRKPDGSKYKSSSLCNIYAGLNRYITSEIDPESNLYRSPQFLKCNQTVDGIIRNLQSQEPTHKKQAQYITPDLESNLWEKGVMGDDTPSKLLNTLLFMCGKYFGLRGGDELRNIRANCFSFRNKADGIVEVTYNESTSKCVHGGLSRRHLPKSITFSEKVAQRYSFHKLFKKYLALCPENDLDCMWLRPRAGIMSDEQSLWYIKRVVGRSTLGSFVKSMMAQIGEHTGFSNHSLRVTAVNTLVEQGFSDSDIMQVTGHRSATTVAGYRRNANQAAISNALSSAAATASGSSCFDPDLQACLEDMEKDRDFNEGLFDNSVSVDVQTTCTIPPQDKIMITLGTDLVDYHKNSNPSIVFIPLFDKCLSTVLAFSTDLEVKFFSFSE